MKKKVISVLAAAAVATSMFATPVLADGSATAGVVWYNFADTFIANARQCLNGIAAADGTISITDADSENDINTQGNNVNNFYTQGVKYLILNNINMTATDDIAKQMKEEGVVGIFANTTSPSDDAFADNENLWLSLIHI